MTLARVLLMALVSKGGWPTNSVYNIQPSPQTSTSSPCDVLSATYKHSNHLNSVKLVPQSTMFYLIWTNNWISLSFLWSRSATKIISSTGSIRQCGKLMYYLLHSNLTAFLNKKFSIHGS